MDDLNIDSIIEEEIEYDEIIVKNTVQLVVFRLAKEEYAIEISQVKEIRKLAAITRVPKAQDYYLGIINLRGNVVPIIDLKKRMNLPSVNEDIEQKIIILHIENIVFGITVDGVSEVTRIDKDDIELPNSLDLSLERRFISGIGKFGKRLFIIPNLREILGLESE